MPETNFAERLLDWHAVHGRHDLPWQQPRTPYRVWVSEVMLQQTRVDTAIPYFERFMARFPDIAALAAAEPDDVLALWSGLGYYARARNLHRAAREINARHDGELPADLDALQALPGIGRSTAGAILSLGFGVKATILDGNVKRVLARRHALDGWPGTGANLKRLWEYAEVHTPNERAAEYSQAVMDLGATICLPRNPACGDCPVNGDCKARLGGLASEIPAPRPRKRLPVRGTRMLVITREGGNVLLERRPDSGIWGGLWSFPECTPGGSVRDADTTRHLQVLREHLLAQVRHTFTHFHLDIEALHVEAGAGAVMEGGPGVWYNLRDAARLALPAPVRRLLEQLTRDTHDEPHGILQEAEEGTAGP